MPFPGKACLGEEGKIGALCLLSLKRQEREILFFARFALALFRMVGFSFGSARWCF
ncbi:hypothetical protein MPNT_30081 [Candidatus Methylacidithermus pantelleriae]|uniref:Uncharacterized protein n=1 Tax=Candidatus Methylacidithermus pantelleriae TaxID=2744239 RepID=A0A8J2BPG1_9BACT|nr:hypothetical protein MPNT_30081 [Candidatus Methylacidithermus pantelleriae]